MGKLHTSMRGEVVDMDKMSLQFGQTPAVGNMKVNARGDELGYGGAIVKTREQVLQDFYAQNPNALRGDDTSNRATKK